jgi:hypothetical protein
MLLLLTLKRQDFFQIFVLFLKTAFYGLDTELDPEPEPDSESEPEPEPEL